LLGASIDDISSDSEPLMLSRTTWRNRFAVASFGSGGPPHSR
jgi:hypothetical protein